MKVELMIAAGVGIAALLLFVFWKPARIFLKESILHPGSESVIDKKQYTVTSRTSSHRKEEEHE